MDREIQDMSIRGGHFLDEEIIRSMLKHSVFNREKRWWKLSGHQHERVEQMNSIWSFENGGSFPIEKNAIARRLNMQDKLKKRIFCSTRSQKVPEICDIPMERISIRISVLMFRSAFSSSNIYKINEKTLHQD